MGTAASPKRAMPGPVAERGGEGRSQDQGHVLDSVVFVDDQVAGGGDLEVEEGVVGQRVEQVVVEADARVDASSAPVPSSLSVTVICVSRV